MATQPTPRILVVDDDPDLVESVSMKLESRKYRVAKAYDGVEAFEKIKEERPDLIILDEPTRGIDVGAKSEIYKLLNDLALNKIPTHTWTANVAFFQLLLFAYNLLHWFKRLCLPELLLGMTTDTLRHQFLELPGKLNHTAGKNVLLLPKDYPYQGPFLKAVQHVAKLKKRPAP